MYFYSFATSSGQYMKTVIIPQHGNYDSDQPVMRFCGQIFDNNDHNLIYLLISLLSVLLLTN